MKNSLTVLGATLIIGVALYLGLSHRVPTPPPPNSGRPPIEDNGLNADLCSVCGKDRVSAHGRILVKNITNHEVTVYVRHHPDAEPTVLKLDPKGFEVVPNILVGTLQLRFVGEGFEEESYCTILANTQHEMWWTTRGPEMHGAPKDNM